MIDHVKRQYTKMVIFHKLTEDEIDDVLEVTMKSPRFFVFYLYLYIYLIRVIYIVKMLNLFLLCHLEHIKLENYMDGKQDSMNYINIFFY